MNIEKDIATGKYKNIIVLTGAGVSRNSGIADYRSEDGIFGILKKRYKDISTPEMIFSRYNYERILKKDSTYLEYLDTIRSAKPNSAHYFLNWLNEKGWLKRVYTQNIDGLHQKAGLPENKVVEFHGSIHKNNVVMYGDPIPYECYEKLYEDFQCHKAKKLMNIDLILVMGTTLEVAPFCAIPNLVPKDCTRILVTLNPKMIDDKGFLISFKKKRTTTRSKWFNDTYYIDQHIIDKEICTWVGEINKFFY